MYISLFVGAILLFALAGLIVGLVAPILIFESLKSKNSLMKLILTILLLLIPPAIILFSMIYLELDRRSYGDLRNTIDSSNIISNYIFKATPTFLAVALAAKYSKLEGRSILLWGSLFIAFALPVLLLPFGIPIFEFIGNFIWDEKISVRGIRFY